MTIGDTERALMLSATWGFTLATMVNMACGNGLGAVACAVLALAFVHGRRA